MDILAMPLSLLKWLKEHTLNLRRLRLDEETAAWRGWTEAQEKRIALAEQLGDSEQAARLRQEYATQLRAWQAQQELKGLVPKKLTSEPLESLTKEELGRIRELVRISEPLKLLLVMSLYTRGKALHELGEYANALACFDQVITLRREFAEAHTARGVVLVALDRFDDALAAHARAISVDPQLGYAYSNRGVVLQRLGRHEDAVAAFMRAVQLNPEDDHSYYHLGMSLESLGRHEEAVKAFDKLLEFAPQNAQALAAKSRLLEVLGRYEEAIEVLDQYLTLTPEDAHAHFHRGIMLSKMFQPAEAVKAYDRSIELQPNVAAVHVNRGAALLKLGDVTGALEARKKALELQPNDPELHMVQGATLWLLERYDQAFQELEKALQLRPQYPEALFVRANVLERLGQAEEALQSLDLALECATKVDARKEHESRSAGISAIEIFQATVSLLLKLGRDNKALVCIERGLLLLPDHPILTYDKACLLAKTGDSRKALEWLGKAIQLDRKYCGIAQADPDFSMIRVHPDLSEAFDSLTKAQ